MATMSTLVIIEYPSRKAKGLRFWKKLFGMEKPLIRPNELAKPWFKKIAEGMAIEGKNLIQYLLSEPSLEKHIAMVQIESPFEITVHTVTGESWKEVREKIVAAVEDNFPTDIIRTEIKKAQ